MPAVGAVDLKRAAAEAREVVYVLPLFLVLAVLQDLCLLIILSKAHTTIIIL